MCHCLLKLGIQCALLVSNVDLSMLEYEWMVLQEEL